MTQDIRAALERVLNAVDNLGHAEGGLDGLDHLTAVANAGRAALAAPPVQSDVVWTLNTFDGPPPDGYTDWRAFVAAPVKQGAYIRALKDGEFEERLAAPQARDELSLLKEAVLLEGYGGIDTQGHDPQKCVSVLCNAMWLLEGRITRDAYDKILAEWKADAALAQEEPS